MLDEKRWLCLCDRIGAREGKGIKSVFRKLTELYSEPHRAYHTGEHINYCLKEFDEVRWFAKNPDAVEAAIWFHDAIYNSGKMNNEYLSAQFAIGSLWEIGIPVPFLYAFAGSVMDLILATEHAFARVSDVEAKIITDVDLAGLAAPFEIFKENDRKIRREFPDLSDKQYYFQRDYFFRGLLQRKCIYRTAVLHLKFEEQARINIEKAIVKQ